MTPERFRAIVDAYGADAARWPLSERDDAQAWASAHRREAEGMLEAAASLDDWLACDVAVRPDEALYRRIVAGAPVRAGRVRWVGFGWPGVALAGIGIVGGVACAFMVSFMLVTGATRGGYDAPESSYLATGFGHASEWSGE
jgi:hypothetical protein